MSFRSPHGGGGYSGLNRHYQQQFLLADTASLPLSTVLSYALLILIGAYTFVHYLELLPILPPSQLAWKALVHATPPTLVIALEGRRASSSARPAPATSYAETRTFAAKSEAMRAMLGLSGNGFTYSVQHSRRFSSLGGLFRGSGTASSLPGLGNWDNSCYQNSILQGLASLPCLYAFLEESETLVSGGERRPTNIALRHLIEELNSPKNLGRKMWTPSVLKSMSSWQQQDAQEYYAKVVDALEKELGKGIVESVKSQGLKTLPRNVGREGSEKDGSEEMAKIRNPLEGMLAQRVGCMRCGYVEGLSLIPFNCLTVSLGNLSAYDIGSCLDEYTGLEPITGVECPRCTLLRQKEILEKLVALEPTALSYESHADGTGEELPRGPKSFGTQGPTNFPQSDVNSAYHGKDEADQALNGRLKQSTPPLVANRLDAVVAALESGDFSDATLSKKCLIPEKHRVLTTKTRQAVIARAPPALVIHVNRSVYDEYTGALRKNSANVRFPKYIDLSRWSLGSIREDTETWSSNPAQSMLERSSSDADSKATGSACIYALRAVVTHQGRHENGHYIAYRRSLPPESDPKASPTWWRLSDEDVTVTSEEMVLAQGGVFMLFYERASKTERIEYSQAGPWGGATAATMSSSMEASLASITSLSPLGLSAAGFRDTGMAMQLAQASERHLLVPARTSSIATTSTNSTNSRHRTPAPRETSDESHSSSLPAATTSAKDEPAPLSSQATTPRSSIASAASRVSSSSSSAPAPSSPVVIPARKASKAAMRTADSTASAAAPAAPSVPRMRTAAAAASADHELHAPASSPQLASPAPGIISAN